MSWMSIHTSLSDQASREGTLKADGGSGQTSPFWVIDSEHYLELRTRRWWQSLLCFAHTQSSFRAIACSPRCRSQVLGTIRRLTCQYLNTVSCVRASTTCHDCFPSEAAWSWPAIPRLPGSIGPCCQIDAKRVVKRPPGSSSSSCHHCLQ